MRYKPERDGLRRYLVSSPELRQLLRDRAEVGARHARSIAPVDDGEYRAGIGVEDGPVIPGRGRFGPRQSVNLVANAPHSAAVEFGHSRVRGQHVLARSIDAIENG